MPSQVARLARLTDAPPPAVTRLVFTPRDVEAREYVRGLMLDAGLEVGWGVVRAAGGRARRGRAQRGTQRCHALSQPRHPMATQTYL